MSQAKRESTPVPDQVIEVLKNAKIGYLSVLSKSEELYSYPVAFHYSDQKLYFMTPISAAKFKILKANPTVSFIVDNGKVTTEACGAMVQGKSKIFTIGRTLVSILSVGPKMIGFTKKYPGMLSFYARGKELPDERKLYKYRLIRIDPSKIIYWLGYKFGRFVPRTQPSKTGHSLRLSKDESGLELSAKLLESSNDEDVLVGPVGLGHDWIAGLDSSVSEGTLSDQERKMLGSFRGQVSPVAVAGAAVSGEEKNLLRMSKR
ncbi:MAG TPA: pyridoxamine 5'-phosphate oxidase family protein [Candidatus Bathyarchaeia archaeon]|nr:pyridoxamine 5'-phosphate oxidase family protein [Candidatus Bathyarchaeia archaeon]